MQKLKSVVKQSVPRKILEYRILRQSYENLRQLYRSSKRLLNPRKSARTYIRKGISRTGFFDILHERGIDYALLRWWQDFPNMPQGEDMDILIKDEHRDLISDLITFRDYGTDLKCDIYTVEGSRFGSHKGLPYLQNSLANTLLQTKRLYKGVYVPGGQIYFASLAYHALFHKGDSSGLPGFDRRPIELEHDYFEILTEESQMLNLKLEISANGIYSWLEDQNFLPAEDTLTKLVEIRPELSFLQRSLYSDVRGGELLVFVIRERLVNDGLLNQFQRFLKDEFQFEIVDVRVLEKDEIKICQTQIRGGKWDKGPYKFSGGAPAALVVAFDARPWPLTPNEQLKQSRMTNRNNLLAKYKFREYLNRLVLQKGPYNGIHSADNEMDALSYISLLDKSYFNKVTSWVEQRRNCRHISHSN